MYVSWLYGEACLFRILIIARCMRTTIQTSLQRPQRNKIRFIDAPEMSQMAVTTMTQTLYWSWLYKSGRAFWMGTNKRRIPFYKVIAHRIHELNFSFLFCWDQWWRIFSMKIASFTKTNELHWWMYTNRMNISQYFR